MQGQAEQPRAEKLAGPYLLATPIPVMRSGGGWAVPQLWGKDLLLHTGYIDGLVLAAPMAESLPPGEPPMRIPDDATLRVQPLPPMRSVLGALVRMPVTIARLWREIGRAKIVHCGIGGWPVPFAWFVAPMARLRGRFLIIIIESAAWRSIPDSERGLRRLKLRLKRWLYEAMGRRCVRAAGAVFYTQAEYQSSFPSRHQSPEHVLPASWIDAADILTDEQAAQAWQGKLADPARPLRLVFAGRLAEAKGLPLLLEAMQSAREAGTGVELDIYGFGELEAQCRAAADRPGSGVRFLGTLPYGSAFFKAIGGYDAVVVPSLSDEQPRIVFDAFSQAVPVLASATAGHRGCVSDGVTGLLFDVNDAGALRRCIERVAADRGLLAQLGNAGLAAARANTHQAMHARRFELIRRAMAAQGT